MDFVNSWFKHPEWWFDSTNKYDVEIVNKYGYLIDEEFEHEFNPLH